MKNIKFLFVSILSLSLIGCSQGVSPTSGSTSTTSGAIISSTSSFDPVDKEHIQIDLTAINDFHGIIEGRNKEEVGLSKLSSYLKERKLEGSILINSGDMYQGSFMSSYKNGEIVSKTFKNIGFDSYTIGNHEFDWNISSIKENEKLIGSEFLGANIYDYNSKTKYEGLGKDYNIVTLFEDSEIETKIGIIGVIGRDQISSITSTRTKDIYFIDPNPIVKNLSNKLKEEEGCDIVVASFHDSLSLYEAKDIASYVDAVFMGHTHQEEYFEVGEVPFMQAESYGTMASEVKLILNKLTGEVTLDRKNTKNVYLSSLNLVNDPYTDELIKNLKEEIDPIANKVVANNSAYIDRYDMSRFYSKIAYDKAIELGESPDVVLFNYSREPLRKGSVTYSQLFETHPFKNELYIMSVSKEDLITEWKYNNGYNPLSLNPYSLSKDRYNVLTFDYTGFHIDINSKDEKYYNYFPSAFNEFAEYEPKLLKENNIFVNVFDLALDRLEKNPNITSSDYSGELFI